MRRTPFFLFLLFHVASAPAAGGQTPFPYDSTPPMVLTSVSHDRWVHEGQHPGFVGYLSNETRAHVRRISSTRGSGFSMLKLGLGNREATLSLGSGNRVNTAIVEVPPLTYGRWDDPGGGEDRLRRMLLSGSAAQALPYARLWEIAFPFPDAPLGPGMAWTDTLSFMDEPGDGLSEVLDGVWQNTVVGDTLLGARRLPVVRTSARVRYRSTRLVADAALEGDYTVERAVSGTLVGLAVVDTVVGVRAGGADTASWAGTAVLRTHDGHAFTSGVRYDRFRTWTLQDSTVWADSVQAERRRRGGGMVRIPSDALQERLVAGDTVAVDSLFQVWRNTHDPRVRWEVERLLTGWAARGMERARALEARLADAHREMGDSTHKLLDFPRFRSEPPVDPARARRMLTYLDDMGRLWRLGVVPTWTYGEVARVLLAATPILEPDSTAWGCEPAACRLFLDAAETAAEPRLRDAALVGLLARDPGQWFDRVQARADSGSRVVGPALLMARGVGATWPAAPKDPAPPPEADWRVWLSWMGGSVRFEESHRNALRMFAARKGRDLAAELRNGWPPESDSAILVLGTVLQGMGTPPVTSPEGLADEARSGSTPRIALARREIARLLRRAEPTRDTALAREVVSAVLDSVFGGGDSPWPLAAGVETGPGGRVIYPLSTSYHGAGDVPLFIAAETLPEGVAARLPPGVQVVDSATWAARPPRAGGVILTVTPVKRVGDLMEVSWSWVSFFRREADQTPEGYAGGGGLTLVLTEEGWRVVEVTGWIT